MIFMITKEEAKNLALEEILRHWSIENDEPVILDDYTIERDYGILY